MPATEVWVAAVVPVARAADGIDPPTQSDGAPSEPTVVLQAPGWIEPDPYPINVPALVEGVVKDVLVLEGDRVEAGQVVARLIDDDARMNLRAEQATLDVMRAERTREEMEARASWLRIAETADQLDRARQLAASGAGVEAERVQLEFRLKALEQSAHVAQADVDVAAARVRQQEVVCDRAAMQLSRMQVVSPSAGVVMNRFVEPGSRVTLAGMGGAMESRSSEVIRLYDPSRLQVRVDVALADIAAVRIGAVAEIVTEALADRTFVGVVTRIAHEGNIQRNTIPLKVSIQDTDPVLKPQMLVKVRIMSVPSTPNNTGRTSNGGIAGGMRMLIPAECVLDRNGDAARVWTVAYDPIVGAEATRQVQITATKSSVAGYFEVATGLKAGDKVVVDPSAILKEGARVRVLGERDSQSASNKGGTP